MPMMPPSRCTMQLCKALAVRNARCEEHQPPPWRNASKAWQNVDRKRWAGYSRAHLRNEPLCRLCGKPATQTDHIIPLSHGGSIWDKTNHQSLCTSCHTDKTLAERADSIASRRRRARARMRTQ